MYALTEPAPHPGRTIRVVLLILILLALATLCFVTPVAGGPAVTGALPGLD